MLRMMPMMTQAMLSMLLMMPDNAIIIKHWRAHDTGGMQFIFNEIVGSFEKFRGNYDN